MKNLKEKIIKLFFNTSDNAELLCRLALRFYNNQNKLLAHFIKIRLINKYGIHLGLTCSIGSNIKFPHPDGIIIGEGVKIGDNCTVYHQVTFGKKYGNLDVIKDYPIIGNNVTIFAGSKIIGDIKIGDNSIIGANSVVLTDVEPNSLYVGIPARRIKKI